MVDETLFACRDLRPREALEMVRKARRTLPGDERLLSKMERLLCGSLPLQQTVEEHRDEYLARATEALNVPAFR